MGAFLAHWAIVTLGLAVAASIVPGIRVASATTLIVASLVLGFVNAVIRPVLVVLTLPITILTLGLFYLVVNGIAFWIAAFLVPGFSVSSVGSAIVGAIVVSLVSWFIGSFAHHD